MVCHKLTFDERTHECPGERCEGKQTVRSWRNRRRNKVHIGNDERWNQVDLYTSSEQYKGQEHQKNVKAKITKNKPKNQESPLKTVGIKISQGIGALCQGHLQYRPWCIVLCDQLINYFFQ